MPTTITPADDGRTVDMTVGDTFLLQLGDSLNWQVSIDDQAILSRVPNITVVRGAQGVYRSNRAGTTLLNANGTPICSPGVPCPQFVRRFTITVSVH